MKQEEKITAKIMKLQNEVDEKTGHKSTSSLPEVKNVVTMEVDPWKTPVKPILENFEPTSPNWPPN